MFGKMNDPFDGDEDTEGMGDADHVTETRTITRHKKTGKIVSNTKHSNGTVAAERKGPRVPGVPQLPSPAAAKPGGTPSAKKSAFKGGKASGSAAKKDGVAALKSSLLGRGMA